MKKTLFLAAALVASTAGFAQMANIKEAKKIIASTDGDYQKATLLMSEAIQNDETKDLTETWYVAGLVGYNQAKNMDEGLMGLDEDAKGQACLESFDYWKKAYEMAMTPTINKKGKEVVDTKTAKSIASKMLDYYLRQDFVKYGVFLNGNSDYAAAYEAFIRHLQIPDLKMFDEKQLAKMPKDSTYTKYKYFAALFAMQAKEHQAAIVLLEDLKDQNEEVIACTEFLAQEYLEVGDTVNYIRTLQLGVDRYPAEQWFLQNLTVYYNNHNQQEVALATVNDAISKQPAVVLYRLIKADLFEKQKKYDEAKAVYEEALTIDANDPRIWGGLGYLQIAMGNELQEKANYAKTNKEYDEIVAQQDLLYVDAVKYYEKAHELKPDEMNYLYNLKSCYYRLMQKNEDAYKAKYEAVAAEIDNF